MKQKYWYGVPWPTDENGNHVDAPGFVKHKVSKGIMCETCTYLIVV
jgi:hypothetical protein